jgi:hypothetical protein
MFLRYNAASMDDRMRSLQSKPVPSVSNGRHVLCRLVRPGVTHVTYVYLSDFKVPERIKYFIIKY